MASYTKRDTKWRAQVKVGSVRETKTFATKGQAKAWAEQREEEIASGISQEVHTLGDALKKYAETESPKKKGERWEVIRLSMFARTMKFIERPIGKVTAADIAGWRDDRMAGFAHGGEVFTAVSGPSVRREMILLRSVFEIARKEWGWLAENPMEEVKKPIAAASRKRRVSDDEAQRLCFALGWLGDPPKTVQQRVAVAFMFALETAMRSGEICSLTWGNVNLAGCFVTLPKTKNGDARDVPLSAEARRLLSLLQAGKPDELVFDMQGTVRDTLFRRARDKASLEDLTFHDSRHEACTRLAKKLDVLELARMIGHRDLKSLMIYFNATATEIAARLG